MCCKCILYPKTQIVICCSIRKQSAVSIVKIKQFLAESPILRSEISILSDSINNPSVVFHNGSTIKVATMSQGARSARATVVVLDEFAWGLDQEIVDSVIVNFLGDYRRTGYLTLDKYLKDPQYEYLKEKPCEMYLSSAGHKGSWQYTRFIDYTNKFISGDSGNYFTCNICYMTAISAGLRTKSFYYENMTKDGFNKQKGDAEYLGIWMTDAENGFFTFESLDNCRTLRKAIYPTELNDFIISKNKKYLNPKKPSGALRILGADIAFLKRKDKNDASCFIIMQLIPNTKTVTITEANGEKIKVKTQYYERQVIYIETQQGMLIEKQAERLKQLYSEFDCDKMIVDAKNAGEQYQRQSIWKHMLRIEETSEKAEMLTRVEVYI